MEKENLKKDYVPPLLYVVLIELENGIAGGSASTVKPIEETDLKVEDWNKVKGNDGGFIDI